MPPKPKDDYIDVAERLQLFYAKYPDGRLATAVVKFCQWPSDGIFAQAEAYRSPDDPKPGIGSAWEPVPGKTPFTRDSEVQNAETAAWGRAMAACGIGTNRGIASAEEVRSRQESPRPEPAASAPGGAGPAEPPVEGEPSEDERAAAQRSTIDLREGAAAKVATKAQLRKMRAMQHDLGLSDDQMRGLVKKIGNVDSSLKMPRAKFSPLFTKMVEDGIVYKMVTLNLLEIDALLERFGGIPALVDDPDLIPRLFDEMTMIANQVPQ